jgi:hypothetical protein
MPKQTLKITEFYGGMNNASKSDNIKDHELSAAMGCSVSSIGQITNEGEGDNYLYTDVVMDGNLGEYNPDMAKEGSLLYIQSDWKWNLIKFECSGTMNAYSPGTVWGNDADFYDQDTDVGVAQSISGNYITLYNYKVAGPNSWQVNDALYIGSGFDEETASSASRTIVSISYPVSVGGGESFLVYIAKDQRIHLKPESAAIWTQSNPSANSATAEGFNSYYANSILRVSDTDFTDANNQSFWFGHISYDNFQHEAGVPIHKVGKFIGGNQDNSDAIDNLTLKIIDVTTEMPSGDDLVNNMLGLLYTNINSEDVHGEWNGSYQFGAALSYAGGKAGKLVEFDEKIPMVNSHFSFSLALCLADSSVLISVPHVLMETNADAVLGDHRIEGITLYFKEQFDDEWYVLEEIDLATGNEKYWDTYASDTQTDGTWDADALILNLPTAELDRAAYKPCTLEIGHTNQTVHYIGQGRAFYAAMYGFHISPAYALYTAHTSSIGDITMDNFNPAEGTNSVWWELVDENLNYVATSPKEDYVTLASDYVVPVETGSGTRKRGGGTRGRCYVAAELWGWQSAKMLQARHYIISTNNWFTRLYIRYGEKWANIVSKHTWIKSIIRPIWTYMSKKGSKYYNKPMGYPKIIDTVRILNDRYSGLFNYYLVGSNARNEKITQYYDIKIVPITESIDYSIWEDVLKTLHYVKEEDGRSASATIDPEFSYMKDYSGNEVFKHRNDYVNQYFYYDPSHLKGYVLESIMESGHVENIQDNLWINTCEFICSEWRERGLDKLPSFHREII